MPAGNERLIQSDYEYNGGTGFMTLGQYALNFLTGKLVITEEPYVNPTAVSRSGDYLDIDVENWNLDTCPYAGFDFDTSALPAGFRMNDLDFVVTYNGEVTTNLDLDCTKAHLENVAALKIDEEQGTVRLYPLWQGTYTITAQLKQGVIVTIPASVEMDETGKASLPLSCSQLEGGSRVTVTVDSANDMKLQGETGTIAYTLTAQNGMAIFDGNTAATFTGTGETTLSLNVAEGQDLAPGTYTDTLTFTASAE